MVRRMPTPPLTIISAAAMPVIREIWAFQSSASSGGLKYNRKWPCSSSATSCSGIGRLAPPRLRSKAIRLSPTSFRSMSRSSADPESTACWTAS